jgi:hypothetical protein
MPSAEYKGEDYQLDQAVALILAGKAIAEARMQRRRRVPAAAPATP